MGALLLYYTENLFLYFTRQSYSGIILFLRNVYHIKIPATKMLLVPFSETDYISYHLKIKTWKHRSHGFFLLIYSPKLLSIKINFTMSLRIPKNSSQDFFGSKRKQFWYSKIWPLLVNPQKGKKNKLILVRW